MALTAAQRTAAATAMVDHYAPGAPAEVRTAAVELIGDSLQDPPYENEVHFEDQQVSTHNLGASIIRRCGASSILAPWRRPRALALTVPEATR